MGSSLRARLAAMGSQGGQRAPSGTRGLSRLSWAFPLPPGLESPNPAALSRMGFDGGWPGLEQALFLDTETTGLAGGAGTIAFMVGLAYVQDGRLALEQFTLGDYGDEPQMMGELARLLNSHSLVVTFNGRTFDLPLLKSRFTMLRMAHLWREPEQLDLLPPARRLWKKRLGSVRLAVLEEKVLRAGREEDLPGSEAPRRFFDYLKTGNRELLEPVAQHNRLDVLALPRLLGELLEAYGGPAPQREAEDLLSLGRVLERRGERGEAARCYHMASLPRPVTCLAGLRQRRAAGEAAFALGLLYKRLGKYQRAAEVFEGLAAQGQMGVMPLVELAKYWEHRARDYGAALDWTRRALTRTPDEEERAALERRALRLNKKMDREEKSHGISSEDGRP